VLSVLSGDTYRLANGYKVKLVGVQCPWEGHEETTYAQRAIDFAHQLLHGRLIKLMFDQRRNLEDGTFLAYIFLPNGVLVNEELLREGFVAFDPDQEIYEEMAERFRRAQTMAERFHSGMWDQPEAVVARYKIEASTAAILPVEATPEITLPPEPPPVHLPTLLPDKIILVTGEEIEGKVVGDPESPFVTVETGEGNVIAISRRRISEIKHQ